MIDIIVLFLIATIVILTIVYRFVAIKSVTKHITIFKGGKKLPWKSLLLLIVLVLWSAHTLYPKSAFAQSINAFVVPTLDYFNRLNGHARIAWHGKDVRPMPWRKYRPIYRGDILRGGMPVQLAKGKYLLDCRGIVTDESRNKMGRFTTFCNSGMESKYRNDPGSYLLESSKPLMFRPVWKDLGLLVLITESGKQVYAGENFELQRDEEVTLNINFPQDARGFQELEGLIDVYLINIETRTYVP